LIYLDNAATTWPKPEIVYRAVDEALRRAANPGRGGYDFSQESSRRVLAGRETVARFFNVPARQIIFTAGATDSINMVIYGLQPLSKILSVGFEHNALWRPLEDVARRFAVDVQYINPLAPTDFDWDMYRQGLEGEPDLVAISHASNVTGQTYPLGKMVQMAKDAGALTLVDVAQTAGVLDLDFSALGLDFAAFPGHKGLLGPQGIGGLYIRPGAQLRPRRLGGTGSKSSSPLAPEQLPDRHESGTLNVPGIAGMAAGIGYLSKMGLDAVCAHEGKLRERAVSGLRQLGAKIYGGAPSVGVLSFNLPGLDSSELAYILGDSYSICVRGGLHCSPRGHSSLGTTDLGTVRVSPGIFNTEADIDKLLVALSQLQNMR